MQYDLIIVGGGMVGAGLAALLEHANLNIALIDAHAAKKDDPRLFALNYNSCQLLEKIGIWQTIASEAAAIHQVHISNRGYFGAVRLHRDEVALPTLGHVIPAYLIEAQLNAKLSMLPHVTCIRPATVKKLTQTAGMATVTLKHAGEEKVLCAPLVIGADGTESTVRTQLNIPTARYDYKQQAIVTRTQLQRPHQHIAYERFTPNGAIAMLPLIGQECATIWTVDHALSLRLLSLSDTDFLHALQEAFGYRLGRLQCVAKRHVYPLRRVVAEKAVEQCVYLLGNAQHTLHPIAAQGFNLALFEAAQLAEVLIEKLTNGKAIQASDLAISYAKTEQQLSLSLGVSHRLTQLFSRESSMINGLLQLGMVGFDLVRPLKRRFIQQLLGRQQAIC